MLTWLKKSTTEACERDEPQGDRLVGSLHSDRSLTVHSYPLLQVFAFGEQHRRPQVTRSLRSSALPDEPKDTAEYHRPLGTQAGATLTSVCCAYCLSCHCLEPSATFLGLNAVLRELVRCSRCTKP